MNSQKKLNGKIKMKLKAAFLMLLVTIFSISGITTVNAATINNDGKYTLILTCGKGGMDGKVDGDYSKMIKFDVADGETIVKLSELTAGVVAFNGETKFSYWAKDSSGELKAEEELALSDFTATGNFWANDGDVSYANGLTLYATFSDEALKGTGTYYLTLDGFGGDINGKKEITMVSNASEYQTVDLTQYTPVRDGYTFVGWDLGGKYVTSVTSDCFAEKDAVTVTATYIKNSFDGKDRVLVLNANGGTIDGKEVNKYDYVGGRDSGSSMSLIPYVPVREGYTFAGWNTKSDGSGEAYNYKYIYWRAWDKEYNTEFEKDTVLYDYEGYITYQNLTLYATWTRNPETVSEIQSTGETKATIEFADGINRNYRLDIQKVEVKKELADKNVKFIADINVLDANTVVRISDTKMRIRIALPEELKGYNRYEVVYILNDEIKETMPVTVEDGYIVFETSHLSQYGIVATNVSDTGDTGKGTNSPKTGDNSNPALWIAVLFISCGGVIGCTVYGKNRKVK